MCSDISSLCVTGYDRENPKPMILMPKLERLFCRNSSPADIARYIQAPNVRALSLPREIGDQEVKALRELTLDGSENRWALEDTDLVFSGADFEVVLSLAEHLNLTVSPKTASKFEKIFDALMGDPSSKVQGTLPTSSSNLRRLVIELGHLADNDETQFDILDRSLSRFIKSRARLGNGAASSLSPLELSFRGSHKSLPSLIRIADSNRDSSLMIRFTNPKSSRWDMAADEFRSRWKRDWRMKGGKEEKNGRRDGV